MGISVKYWGTTANQQAAATHLPVSFSHEMLRAVIALMVTLRLTCPEALLWSRLQSTQLQNRANSLFHGATEGYARTKFPAPKNQMISPPFIVGQREVLCHPSFAYQVIPSLRTQLKHSSPNNYHLFSLRIHNNYPSGQELGLWPTSAQMCATFLACHVHCLTLGPALRSFHRDQELLPMRDNRSFFQVEMQSQPQWG